MEVVARGRVGPSRAEGGAAGVDSPTSGGNGRAPTTRVAASGGTTAIAAAVAVRVTQGVVRVARAPAR